MAAIFAASAGAEALLLESTRDGGRKILISGGGRCNILPARVDQRRFVTDSSSHALRKMLRAWPLADQIAFFERELEMPLVEEADTAKLFPASNRARDVRDGLLALAARSGARTPLGPWPRPSVPHRAARTAGGARRCACVP
jgi:predicted flavoprotein YhiN